MRIEGQDIVNAAKKQPIAFICVVLVLGLLIFLYFRKDKSSSLQEVVDARAADLQKLKSNVTYSVGLENHLKTLEGINKIIKQGALRPGELAQNQQLFYRLEAETGVKLVDLRQQPQATEKPPLPAYVSVNFSLTIEGEYGQVLLFLKRLESGVAVARISNAIASVNANKVPSVTFTVQMLGARS